MLNDFLKKKLVFIKIKHFATTQLIAEFSCNLIYGIVFTILAPTMVLGGAETKNTL